MATNKSKPKGAKLGASASNLLASFPWLKNKTFLIPALASLLVLSMLGVVLAVQGSNTARSDEGIVEVPLEEPELEIVAEPVIGAACVEGEPVCEFVKVHLLSEHWEEYVRLGYDGFVDYILDVHDVSRDFAEEVLNSVEFNWGNGSTASGSSSPGSGSAVPADPNLDSAVEYVKFYVDDFSFSKVDLIDILMQSNRFTRDEIIAAIDALNVDWNQEALQKAEDFAAQGPFSRERLYWALLDVNFEPSQALAGVDALGIDWYAQAERAALAFLQRQAPPCRFSYDSAVNYLITEEYFTEDEALFGFYPFDDYENDRWLVCGP